MTGLIITITYPHIMYWMIWNQTRIGGIYQNRKETFELTLFSKPYSWGGVEGVVGGKRGVDSQFPRFFRPFSQFSRNNKPFSQPQRLGKGI